MSRRPVLFLELYEFIIRNKKFWMFPMILVILVFGLMIFLSGTPLAPFIYTLF